jgi:uncharacterized protein (TIGR02271 family)
MHETTTIERLSQARGSKVFDQNGDKIGSVEEIFQDYETREPEWIGIGTGMLGTKRVLVPVQGADLRDDGVYVPYTKDQVKDSPDIDADEIDETTEQELSRHYGLNYSERRSPATPAEGGPGTMGLEDEADMQREGTVTRHEEELQVGKRDVEAGRARVRKWVETEPQEVDVALRRETARVTREPVDRPTSGGEIGEEEIDVPLRGEEAVVEKQTVARERITVDKDVETEHATVADEVRKERVELDEDGR